MQYTFRDDSTRSQVKSGGFFAATATRAPVLDDVASVFGEERSTAASAVQRAARVVPAFAR